MKPASILQDISSYIKSGETEEEKLGLEIEHFVVDAQGVQITFDEITALIEKVGTELNAKLVYTDGYPVGYSTDSYAISLEPSCQFEISINPYAALSEIAKVYKDFRAVWEPLLFERGYHILTKGNLPAVELGLLDPNQIPLSPKKRYKYMDAYFRTSGIYGKYMMRASASTQVSVDYRSEADLVKKLRVLQKISPVLMIMMENKTQEVSTLPLAPDRPHLFRIQQWDDLDPDRTGFFPHSFDADFGYEKISQTVYQTPLILLTDQGKTVEVGNKSAQTLEHEGFFDKGIDPERRIRLTEHFLSMGFFHFRIKKYIEVRVADSVPLDRALGYVALLKGLVYQDRNLEQLEKELADIDSLQKIQDAVEKIEKNGFDAVIYQGKTAAQWAAALTELAKAGLPAQEREFLEYV